MRQQFHFSQNGDYHHVFSQNIYCSLVEGPSTGWKSVPPWNSGTATWIRKCAQSLQQYRRSGKWVKNVNNWVNYSFTYSKKNQNYGTFAKFRFFFKCLKIDVATTKWLLKFLDASWTFSAFMHLGSCWSCARNIYSASSTDWTQSEGSATSGLSRRLSCCYLDSILANLKWDWVLLMTKTCRAREVQGTTSIA